MNIMLKEIKDSSSDHLFGFIFPKNLFIYLFIIFIIFIVIYYSCPNFSPFVLSCPSHPLHPQSIPTLSSTSMGHSYMSFD